MLNTLFVLGSDDPEMKKIEDIIVEMNYSFVFAKCKDKNRCTPSNSYFANIESLSFNKFIFIECKLKNFSFPDKAIYFDHHHIGDPGYDISYSDFISGSSLGQFLLYILKDDFYSVIDKLNLSYFDSITSSAEGYIFINGNWYLSIHNKFVIIPKDILFISAIDHCPVDAYNGSCPGIDPKEIFSYRLSSLFDNLNISPVLFSDILNKYQSVLSELSSSNIVDLTHLYLGQEEYTPDYLILRELALSKNIPIAVKINLDNAYKFMFLSLSPSQVDSILESKNFQDLSLTNVFGVPNRGYAGGFVNI